jgi:energy-coupling factor transport system permease protein
VVHRIDPRVKLGLTFVYTILIFIFNKLQALIFNLFVVVLIYKLAKISIKLLWKNLKAIMPMVMLTGLINIFFVGGDSIFEFWWLRVTKQGIFSLLFMVLRITCLISGTALLTFTTSPIALTDAIEYFVKPVKLFGGSPNEIAMIFSIALRFIPTLITEAGKIIEAQKSRGAHFDSPKLMEKLKAYIPVLVPLFFISFKRAEDLAVAMESRCYTGGDKRTRFRSLKVKLIDFWTLVFVTIYIVILYWVNRWRVQL